MPGAHGTLRLGTCTDSVKAARSKVAADMFRAITCTLLLVQAKAVRLMNRVELTSDFMMTRTQKRGDRRRRCTRGRSRAVVGMAANPSGAHQAGRHRAGQILGEAEGACGSAERPLLVEMCVGEVRHDLLHFGTPSTASIEGSGIAASRTCCGFESCQAGGQSDDQFLLLLDRSDQVGHGFLGVEGHAVFGVPTW